MNSQQILKTTLLLTILIMAAACGSPSPGTEPSGEQASRVSPTHGTGFISEKDAITECNQKSQGGVTASIMNYKDGNNKYRDDYMKLKFLEVPASFASGAYFQFFRWKAGSTGKPVLDSVPTKARFETLDGNILTDFANTVSWSQVANIAAASNIRDPHMFMANVRLVIDIRDVALEYDALKIAYYGSSNQVLNNMDMLLPAFNVSPAEYAIDGLTTRSATLQALHPFANMFATSPEQLQATAKAFCFQ